MANLGYCNLEKHLRSDLDQVRFERITIGKKVELYQTNLHQYICWGGMMKHSENHGHWRKEWEAASVGPKPDPAFGRKDGILRIQHDHTWRM